jgi:hypothetical protein
MPKRFVTAILFVLMPIVAFGVPKSKGGTEMIQIQVVSTKTKVHGASPDVFTYTDVIFGRVVGKNLIFVCEERGDACPLMENGKTYDATRMGDAVYISFGATPDSKKANTVKFKQTGSW